MGNPTELRFPFQLDDRLWSRLRSMAPRDVTRRTEASFESTSGRYSLPFMDRLYVLDPEAESIVLGTRDLPPARNFELCLVLLTYLVHAGEAIPIGPMVTPGELPGGNLFFQGPHAIDTHPLIQRFGDSPNAFLKLGERMGGSPLSYGDAAFSVITLPKVPVGFVLYCGDEEFAARMVPLVDRSVLHHFQLDVVFALFNVVIRRLARYSIHEEPKLKEVG